MITGTDPNDTTASELVGRITRGGILGRVTTQGGGAMTRRIVLALFAGIGLAMSGTGCINQYGSDPLVRMDQMINQSEDLRQMGQTWRRFWFNDMPSHMTPERIHGGIM
jgi:hypothetical protein